MGICRESGNRTGFPGAWLRAYVPASLGQMLVDFFANPSHDNMARKRRDFSDPPASPGSDG